MHLKIEFGYVEILLICGVFLCTQNLLGFGYTLCTLSVLAAMTKFGLKSQKDQQEEINHQLLIEGLKNSGDEVAESIVEFLDKTKKTVH